VSEYIGGPLIANHPSVGKRVKKGARHLFKVFDMSISPKDSSNSHDDCNSINKDGCIGDEEWVSPL
jgi:hypothetical protein